MAVDLDFEAASSTYNDLTVKIKDKEMREKIDVQTFENCAHMFKKLSTLPADIFFSKECLSLCGKVFHFLMNSCVHCSRNQKMLLKTQTLQNSLVLIEKICVPFDTQKTDMSLLELTKQSAVKYIGNSIAQNPETQKFVWDFSFPNLFYKLFAYLDNEGKDLLCMVLLNLFGSRESLFDGKDVASVMLSVLDLCKSYQGGELCLLLIEFFITSGHFQTLYEYLDSYYEQRSTMLELIIAYLHDEEQSVKVTKEILLFIAKDWNQTVQNIMDNKNENLADMTEVFQLSRLLLEALCVASSTPQLFSETTEGTKLVESAVYLLSYIDNFDCENTKGLFDGFKSDLVRLIGNLCYGCKEVQDRVREVGGLPRILDCCSLDDSNPYIMQWAIFAIRNICENNLENQKFIAKCEAKEVITDEYLDRQGLRIALEKGKLKVSRT